MSNLSVAALSSSDEQEERAQGASSLEIKSVGKAFKVLEAFNGRERLLSLGELAVRTGLDKSAVQRVTYTLQKLGYLDQDPVTRRYMVAIRVLDRAFGFLRSHPLIERAAPILIDLRRSIGERVDLSLWDHDALVYVLRLQSKREPVLSAAHVGLRIPLYCAAGGRAVLAQLGDTVAAALIKQSLRRAYTPRTIVDPVLIMKEVRKARRQGFAVQVEQWREGEIAVAAAVTDEAGRPVGAVHIVGSTTEWSASDFERKMAPYLTATTRAVSDSIMR